MQDDTLAIAARADYCRLLSACHYQPDPAFIEERMFESMSSAGETFDPGLARAARALESAFTSESMEALLIDYTRLFIGPADRLASPYESTWLGRDGASPAPPVLALYEEGGFVVAETFLDLPDHVAAQLEFLYLLVYRQAEASRDGDVDALARCEDLERRLLGDHLGAWVSPFTASLQTHAATQFYRVLASVLQQFIAGEKVRLA